MANTTAEVMIKTVVYEAALARAKSQAQALRTVAREILFARAALAVPLEQVDRPPARVLGQPPRYRLRFPVSKPAYQSAKERLHAAGISVTAAIEEGLIHFARTGEFR